MSGRLTVLRTVLRTSDLQPQCLLQPSRAGAVRFSGQQLDVVDQKPARFGNQHHSGAEPTISHLHLLAILVDDVNP